MVRWRCREAARASRLRWAWRLAALCCALPGSPAHAQQSSQDAARAAYAKGVAAYEAHDNVRALEQFSAAENHYPSPNIELMLGRTLVRLQHKREAHQMLTRAQRSARSTPKYTSTLTAAQSELQELEQQLAVLRLRVAGLHGDETLRLNGRRVPPEAWAEPVVLEPGSLRVELTRGAAEPWVQQLELEAGSGVTLDLSTPSDPALLRAEATAPQLPAAPASPPATAISPLRTVSYALIGVGAAGLGTFGIFGTMSRTQFSKLETACPDMNVCNENNRVYATHGQTYQTVANVALAAGAAVLATGITLWLVTLPGERATLSLTPSSLRVHGSF